TRPATWRTTGRPGRERNTSARAAHEAGRRAPAPARGLHRWRAWHRHRAAAAETNPPAEAADDATPRVTRPAVRRRDRKRTARAGRCPAPPGCAWAWWR